MAGCSRVLRVGRGMVQGAGVDELRASRVMSQLQGRGWVMAGVSLGLAAAGMWVADGTLAALGLAGGLLLGLAGIGGRWNLARLDCGWECPRKVQAGQEFPLVLWLRNGRRLVDAFGVRMELELPGKSRVAGRAAWVPAGSAADLELRVVVADRGWGARHPLRLKSGFPLGFFESGRTLLLEGELVVVPRPVVPRELKAAGVLLDATPLEGASLGDAAGEPRGLRGWRPGDRPGRLAWPASVRSLARGAGMLVREADPPGFHARRCVVMFHSFGNDGSLIRPDRFERALSMVAGTLRYLHGLGIPAVLVADFDGWVERAVGTRPQLAVCLEVLARASRVAGTEAHEVRGALEGVAEDDSLIVFSDMPPPAWRTVLPARRLPVMTPDVRRKRRPGVERKGGR